MSQIQHPALWYFPTGCHVLEGNFYLRTDWKNSTPDPHFRNSLPAFKAQHKCPAYPALVHFSLSSSSHLQTMYYIRLSLVPSRSLHTVCTPAAAWSALPLSAIETLLFFRLQPEVFTCEAFPGAPARIHPPPPLSA